MYFSFFLSPFVLLVFLSGSLNAFLLHIFLHCITLLELYIQDNVPEEETGTGRVFVAGASGNTGKRIVKELLSCGYKVRAGVRDLRTASNILPTDANVELVSVHIQILHFLCI